MSGVSMSAVERSKIEGEKLFIDISSSSTMSMGGKKHWLLVLEDSSIYALSYF